MNLPKAWNAKLGAGSFFAIKKPIQEVCSARTGFSLCKSWVLVLKREWGLRMPVTHFLYRFLDGKKTTRSQFSIPGLREINRNLKQENLFNSCESFFTKSPFCTFACINPGFGRPWYKLWIFFLVPIFIMLQKNAFGQKKFEFHAQVQKCHFGKIEKFRFLWISWRPGTLNWEGVLFCLSKNLYSQCEISQIQK